MSSKAVIVLQSVVHIKPETDSNAKRESEKFKCCIFFLPSHTWPVIVLSCLSCQSLQFWCQKGVGECFLTIQWDFCLKCTDTLSVTCIFRNQHLNGDMGVGLKTWQDLRFRQACGWHWQGSIRKTATRFIGRQRSVFRDELVKWRCRTKYLWWLYGMLKAIFNWTSSHMYTGW